MRLIHGMPLASFLFIISLILPGGAFAQTTTKHKYKNPTGKEFPLLAWSSFRYENNITEANFNKLKEAGFNISLALVANSALTEKTLKAAKPSGVKIMINYPGTRNLKTIPDAVTKLKNNPLVMGYYLGDEPDASQFKKYKELADEIYQYDPVHLPFVNLLPIVEPERLKAKNYKTYLKDFLTTVGIPMFSYDNYPVVKRSGKIAVKDDFYQNLEIASQVANETGCPFWAFCLSAAHFSYPAPTKASLMFEAFSALAYAAQGLSYYTYTQETDQNIKYSDAPLMANGKYTKTWDYCRDVNRQILALSNVFLGAKLQGAWHTGKQLPKGTKRLNKLPDPFGALQTEDTGVLVSHIKNGEDEYLVIVNHSVTGKQKISLTMGKNVKLVLSDGRIAEASTGNYNLDAGGYLIFKFPERKI